MLTNSADSDQIAIQKGLGLHCLFKYDCPIFCLNIVTPKRLIVHFDANALQDNILSSCADDCR